MEALVPIISYRQDGNSNLQQRIEFLINGMGYKYQWVDDASIISVHQAVPSKVWIPLVIELNDSMARVNNADLLLPILEMFSTAEFISTDISSLPRILYNLPPNLSLWEGKNPLMLVEKAVRYIYKNLENPNLSVPEITRSACVCKDTLEGKFLAWKEHSVWQYVIHLRMKEAARLLEELDEPVYNIAYYVGYEDHTTFDRAFKKEFNVTPRAFRQKVKNFRKKINKFPLFYLSSTTANPVTLHTR